MAGHQAAPVASAKPCEPRMETNGAGHGSIRVRQPYLNGHRAFAKRKVLCALPSELPHLVKVAHDCLGIKGMPRLIVDETMGRKPAERGRQRITYAFEH